MITVPESFRRQPRWWTGGTAWLDALPALVERQCTDWGLSIVGGPLHGSNALVVPVRRGDDRLALRLTPPDDRCAGEMAALEFWAGRGTVLQLAADPARGASLLEWLAAERSLMSVPPAEAAQVLGMMMRRLAAPVSDAAVPRTADVVSARIAALEEDWMILDRPFAGSVLRAAQAAGQSLTMIDDDVAVNGDLHHDQVLAGVREEWLTVDPLLLRGDIGYDLARCLWTRLDDLDDDQMIIDQLRIMADAAGLDRDHACTSAIFRTVDYWLWGLRHGLTEDPVRCARLYAALAPGG